jgi:hypothetical protein
MGLTAGWGGWRFSSLVATRGRLKGVWFVIGDRCNFGTNAVTPSRNGIGRSTMVVLVIEVDASSGAACDGWSSLEVADREHPAWVFSRRRCPAVGQRMIWYWPMGSKPRTFLAGRSAPSLPGPAGIFSGVSADSTNHTPTTIDSRPLDDGLSSALRHPVDGRFVRGGATAGARLRQ